MDMREVQWCQGYNIARNFNARGITKVHLTADGYKTLCGRTIPFSRSRRWLSGFVGDPCSKCAKALDQ